MKLLRLITATCIVFFSASLLSSCNLLPQPTQESNTPFNSSPTKTKLVASVQIETISQASFSAALRYTSPETIPLSGIAIRLVFPKQDSYKDINPFIVPESTRAKFWQPLINHIDCSTNPNNCFAELALLTLNPDGSDFVGLDPIVGLNPVVFSRQVLANTTFDATNSIATTKTAESITLDLRNTLTAE